MSTRPTSAQPPEGVTSGDVASDDVAGDDVASDSIAGADTQPASKMVRALKLDRWPGETSVVRKTSTSSVAWSWILAAIIVSVGSIARLSTLALFAAANDDNLWGLLNKWDAARSEERRVGNGGR